MSDSTPPAAPPPDDFNDLKDSPHWERIKLYTKGRLRGLGTQNQQLEADLAQARAQAAAYGHGAVAEGQAQLEQQQLAAQVDASLGALVGMVPDDRRQLIPADLPPAQRLAWMTANLQQLTAQQAPAVRVYGGPPRAGAPVSADDHAAQLHRNIAARMASKAR